MSATYSEVVQPKKMYICVYVPLFLSTQNIHTLSIAQNVHTVSIALSIYRHYTIYLSWENGCTWASVAKMLAILNPNEEYPEFSVVSNM